jgi:hypothetical protein
LYLTACTGVIVIVWYNGETIREWSFTGITTTFTVLLNLITKIIFNKKSGGNGPSDKGKGIDSDRDIELNNLNDESNGSTTTPNSSNSNIGSSNNQNTDDEITPKSSPKYNNLDLEKEVFNKTKTRRSVYEGNTAEERDFNELFYIEE